MVWWLRLHAPNAGNLGLNTGQGTGSHMPRRKPGILYVTTKTWHSQINSNLKNKSNRFLWFKIKGKKVKLLSCPTLCDPVDYSPPGSSVHGILQARILEWVAISFSKKIKGTGGYKMRRKNSFHLHSTSA